MAVRAFLAATLVASAMASAVTPIQKVLELMDGMLEKGIAEKKAEAVKFSAFNQWCGDQTRIKTNEIAAGDAKIEELKATIEKKASGSVNSPTALMSLTRTLADGTKTRRARPMCVKRKQLTSKLPSSITPNLSTPSLAPLLS